MRCSADQSNRNCKQRMNEPPAQPHFRTPITELFGIRYPILAGGLYRLADAAYVSAAVNAGLMGFITLKTFPDSGAFRAELQKARQLTCGKPFGVNIALASNTDDAEVVKGHTAILLEEGVRLIETSGRPPQHVLPPLKEANCTVMHKVATVRHAISAAKLDVDAIAVVGAECGGHPGLELVGSMVQTVRAAQEISKPLVVGGGFGHGSQLVAALAMGADAILMGTRFLVSEEISAHAEYKHRLLKATETDSRLIMSTFRNTYRVLDNRTARCVAELEGAGETDFERYRPLVEGALQGEAYETGDWEKGTLSMGQSVAFANEIKPLAGIVAQVLGEAEAALRRLGNLRGESLANGGAAK